MSVYVIILTHKFKTNLIDLKSKCEKKQKIWGKIP